MSGRRDVWRIRAGLLCFAATGPLSLGGLILRGPITDQRADPAGWAALAVSDHFQHAWLLLIPSLVLQILGWAALWGFTRGGRAEAPAFWGFVLGVIGNGFWLPSAGVLALVSPALGALWQSGVPAAVEVLNAGLFGPISLPIMAFSAVGLLASSALVAVAIWRDPRLPRWAAVPYALHALCLTFAAPISYEVERMGGALLLISTAAVALAAWRAAGSEDRPG